MICHRVKPFLLSFVAKIRGGIWGIIEHTSGVVEEVVVEENVFGRKETAVRNVNLSVFLAAVVHFMVT